MEELNKVKTELAASDRLMKRSKNFNSKKSKDHKDQKDKKDRDDGEIKALEAKLEGLALDLHLWKQKLQDRDLLRTHTAKTNDLDS